MQRLSITIEDDLKRELDAIAPRGERAAFVSGAIKKAVEEWRNQRALERILAFKPYKVVDRDSVDVLHELREERSQHLERASRS